ncbi:SusC/RagA family TonB-linked outer membrane protein [Ichthyenterobacterium magnum]|uniref:TonB-linked SusC/RagA family outer membrane protein n=1 Tax=Ichthyenterobacterium magnum TaxID=1230530 RepID=A0A420DF20_9FLAO|nr:SusC/RagA family TonB-linked outer membrane protein [Ichthyenterobacterium magnum]RKE90961.1 TonB-linked SusC/RagA family outer membrane protein [Ichthyenterobacterium magnum]
MKTKFSGILTLLLAFVVQMTFAQEKTISGTVSDDSGLPLPGATVLVKGTSTGASTDFDGKYNIKANTGSTLVFSFVGYATQEVSVGASNTINVQLAEDTEALEEVVVTAFGKKKQKRSLGYAATAVSGEKLTEVATLNPFESLSGKVAGVDISAPNQPGASTKIVLRGYGSLNGSGPLYVIDGTPISSASNSSSLSGLTTDVNRSFDGGTNINDLDANSIASINILKGGAATALYGSRANGGAIIITTKKGRSGQKLKVELNSSIDFLEVARIPHLQQRWGQGWNGVDFSGLPNGGQGATNENGSWGPLFNGNLRVWGQIVNASQQIKPYENLEDNIKDFYDIGNTFTNSLRLSGGSDKADFSLIYTRVDTDGIIPTDADALNRNTLSLNSGIAGDKFRLRVNANYAQTRQNAVNTGQGDNAGEGESFMQELIQIPRGVSVLDLADYTNNPFNNNDNFYTPYSRNPYWVLNENETTLDRERFYGNINMSYDLATNLVGTLQIGADISNGTRHSHGAVINYTPGSPQALLGGTTNAGGVTEYTDQRRQYETFLSFDYNKSLSEDFGLEASLGASMNNRYFNSLQVSITNLDIPNFYEISNSAVLPITTQNNSQLKGYSAFGAATLSYKERIYLNVTGRNEWTSTLAIGSNSFFYPSVNLSGIAIDNGEHFLKLRAGYASLANSAPIYLTESSALQASAVAYFGNINFPFAGLNSFEIARTLGNLDIEPEFTDEYEIGFEGRFFNNRVTADVAYYKKTTDGSITSLLLPNSTGYNRIFGNFMDIENKGIEVALGLVPVRTDDFSWNIDYTFTKNENKVTKLPEGLDKLLINSAFGVNFYAIEGQPLGEFQARVPLLNEDGQVVVDPNTGIPQQSTEEQKIGNSQRDFVMGLQNTFKYKNWRLSFGIDWKEGGEMYSYTSRLLNFTGNALSTTYNDRNTFIVPNSVVDNGDGTYSENVTPITFGAVTGYYSASNNPSTEAVNHVIDKTFIRLRDMSISYNFPEKIIGNTGLSSLSLSLYGRNLALWTPDENPYVDPEVTTFGGNDIVTEFGEFAGNPAQRTYGFAIKMSF